MSLPRRSHEKRRGRRTKLHEDHGKSAARIVRYVHEGAYLETAAAAAGWHKDTLFTTLKQGAADRAVGHTPAPWALAKRPEDDPPIPDAATFSDAVEKAQAHSEITDLLVIGSAAMPRTIPARCATCGKPAHCEDCGSRVTIQIPGQWTASAWRLERKFPKRFGRRDHINVAFSKGDLEALATELGRAVEQVIEDALEPDDAKIVLDDIKARWEQLLSDSGAGGND